MSNVSNPPWEWADTIRNPYGIPVKFPDGIEFDGSVVDYSSYAYPRARTDDETDDTAAFTEWQSTVNALGVKGQLRPGETYLITAATMLTVHHGLKGNNAKITVANSGQSNPHLYIESEDSDYEIFDQDDTGLEDWEDPNTWSEMHKGSGKIPELAGQQGWVYTLTSSDSVILARSTGSGAINIGETFLVTSQAGHIYPPLVRSYSTLTNWTLTRRRMRPIIDIEDLTIEYVSGSGECNRAVDPRRPMTRLKNVQVINSSSGKVQQAFNPNDTFGIFFLGCGAQELRGTPGTNTTQYGCNVGRCAFVIFRDFVEFECRRGIDSHGGKDIRIYTSELNSGFGAHWADGVILVDTYLSFNDATENPQCIQFSGSNIATRNCRAFVPERGAVFRMRGDTPEVTGQVSLHFDEIQFDETEDAAGNLFVNIADLGTHASYDAGRSTSLPAYVRIQWNHLIQRGASSDNTIYVLSYSAARTNAEYPQDIVIPAGRIDIVPGAISLEGGSEIAGSPRLQVNFFKADNQNGGRMKVFLDGLTATTVFSSNASSSATDTGGRFDLTITNPRDEWLLLLRPGCMCESRFRDGLDYGGSINKTSVVSAIGDELYLEQDYTETAV